MATGGGPRFAAVQPSREILEGLGPHEVVGQSPRLTESVPAAELIVQLVEQAQTALAAAGGRLVR